MICALYDLNTKNEQHNNAAANPFSRPPSIDLVGYKNPIALDGIIGIFIVPEGAYRLAL